MITSPLVPSTRSVVGLLALLDAPSLFTFLCPFKATNTHSRSAASTNGKSIIPMMDGGDTYAPRRRLPRDDDCCRSFLVASLHLTFLSQASRKTFLGKGAPCTVLSANPTPARRVPFLLQHQCFPRYPLRFSFLRPRPPGLPLSSAFFGCFSLSLSS